METNLIISISQQTPLHVAATEGHDYTVKLLVSKGAKIELRNKNGVSVTILLK